MMLYTAEEIIDFRVISMAFSELPTSRIILMHLLVKSVVYNFYVAPKEPQTLKLTYLNLVYLSWAIVITVLLIDFIQKFNLHGKNRFVTATKLGTRNEFFVASTKNFAAATKRIVVRTKHFVLVTKYFCYPYYNKMTVGITKPFFRVLSESFTWKTVLR